MFLSTPAKIFSAICFLSLAFAGCGMWRGNENSQATLAAGPKSEFPFVTQEPDVFQAELIVRTGNAERRTFIARNGKMQRMDFDLGTENRRAVIITDKQYLLYFKRMVFEERELSSNAAEHFEPLSAQILNLRDFASFDEITRNGSIVQFKARIDESPNSEVQIFFDESIGLPVKQEFYSIEGDARQLEYSVELRDFRQEAGPELFTVPPNFRRQARNK